MVYWVIGCLALIVVIEAVIIGYTLCLLKRKSPEKSQSTSEDVTIPIPRKLPSFTMTVNTDDPFEDDFKTSSEDSLHLSDEYFLAMEKD